MWKKQRIYFLVMTKGTEIENELLSKNESNKIVWCMYMRLKTLQFFFFFFLNVEKSMFLLRSNAKIKIFQM